MRSTELLRQQRERMQSVPGTSPATIFVLGGVGGGGVVLGR